jgi:hypothetical protein
MVADATLIRVTLPLEHDVAGGAETAQQGPIGQPKYGVVLVCGPRSVRVVNGLVLYGSIFLCQANQLM